MVHTTSLFPLSHPQKRILNIENIYKDTPINHIGGLVVIDGKLKLAALQQAIMICIRQTESLRLRLKHTDGADMQFIDEHSKPVVPLKDFSNESNPHESMLEWAEREFKSPFNLYGGPLAAFYVLKVSEASSAYLIKCHHAIADGWSMKIIIDKIKELYCRLTNGEEPDDRTDDFSVLIEKEKKYMSSGRRSKDAAFWKAEFSDLPESFLLKSSDSIQSERKTFRIDPALSKQIYQFAEAQGCSLNTLFTVSLFSYLHRVTGENDLIIGTPVLNRSGVKEKKTAGMTVSTMPFRTQLNENQSFQNFLKDINALYMKYFLHQRYPYDELFKDLQLAKEGYDQLFHIYINSYSTDLAADMEGCRVKYIELCSGCQPYSLQIAIKEWDDGGAIELQFDYKSADYSEEDISQLCSRLKALIQKGISQPDVPLYDLPLLTEQEIQDEIYKWNQTETEYPKTKTICRLFQEQVSRDPNRIAVEDGNRQLSYLELDEQSNQLARYLLDKGLKRGDFIAVSMAHSPDLIAVLLGILKAGGAYVPIDPDYPAERVNYILEDSQSAFFITDHDAETASAHICTIHFDHSMYKGFNTHQPDIMSDPLDIAYMIYTSGSTGRPKGVMIDHQNLVNYITSASENYITSQEDSFALYSSIAFDLTITSIYTPLMSGNKILIYRQDDTDEFVLNRIIRENNVSIIKLTPAHLALLKGQDLSDASVKTMIVGGEQLSADLARQITEASHHKITICNEYGPTEATVGCMIHKYDPKTDVQASVPIGIPMQNTEIYILNDQLEPVLPGTSGEIYISGDGVARGYWNRPEMQKERFLDNPFIQGRKMYKTGDLAKRLKDGKLEYSGRKDHQVKIKGYRIELGEIELALLSINEIKEAVVIDFEDPDGQKQLAAYIVRREGTGTLQFRMKLSEKLPAYMLPAYFIPMDHIPLTQNGKTDRAALPNPLLHQDQTHLQLNQEQKETEKQLLETAGEVLGRPDIKPGDHFYQLGGDSIKAIQLVSKMKEKGLSLKTQDVLTYPIFRELVSAVTYHEAADISQKQAEGSVPAMPITEWFWSLSLSRPNYWHQSVMLTAAKEMDSNKINDILTVLYGHHDALRLSVDKQTKTLFYNNEIAPEPAGYYDLTSLSEKQREQEIENIGERMRAGTELFGGSLFQACVIKAGSQTHLLLTAHHLITDGVSWQILIEDFLRLFHSPDHRNRDILPSKTHSYQYFAAKLNEMAESAELLEESGYWEEEVQLIKPIYGRSSGTLKGQDKLMLKRRADKELTKLLTGPANEAYQTQTNELLLAALVRACRYCTGKDYIALELEGHGREAAGDQADVSRTIGWFTAMYPAVFKITEQVSDQIRTVKEKIRNIPGKGSGYGILTFLSKRLKEHDQPELRFNYLGEVDQMLSGHPDYRMTYLGSGSESAIENDLTASLDLTAGIYDGLLTIDLISSASLFDKEELEELLDQFILQLSHIAAHCSDKEETDFTPSDFETASFTLDEMDSLFT
ncbi:amino acid adenylation domain-containing protein [Bacillus sp. YC2]|uniref:non-ribosomal peptide synthetase n=1 Tax=Bacillus sp. YC2 TaxID=2861287 RepID=UPI001CA74B34|nr:non-ribosomal peptide synthetase [Bacillus sp. YC2]MBY8914137.1 amino acid adenylation domain-containing protein [Bacillus sp. YC2]